MSDVLVAVCLTGIITAILTSLLTLFCLCPSAREAHQAKEPAAIITEKTYRVRGIPDTCATGSAENLLRSILEKHEINLHFKAYSLAYDPSEEPTKVATVTIRGDPTDLCHSFPIPEERLSDANRKLGQLKIMIDDDFVGFTPLNAIETSEHMIELVNISCQKVVSAHTGSCIAISGLGGHAFGSFKEKKGEHMWLRDSLPHHIPGLRVFIYGYPSQICQSNSHLELEGISTTFMVALRAIRRVDNVSVINGGCGYSKY